MVSIRMIIKLGPKNELQTLGFRTYYNQCARPISLDLQKAEY